MPRVAIKRKEYKINDLSKWIVGQMYAKGLTQLAVAESIGISQPAFCKRLKTASFTYEQLLMIFEKLGASDEEIVRMMKLKGSIGRG